MHDHNDETEGAIDALLVARAREGDDHAFTQLVRRHELSAQRLAAFVCGSNTEAFDVAQEAFLVAYTRLHKLDDDLAFRAWLMRITANTAKNRMRSVSRRARRDNREAAFARAPSLSPEDHAVAGADAASLWRALGQLDERERVVVALRYAAGLSEAETAASLGIPAGTVKSRTSRAMAALRDILEEARD